MFFGCAQRQKFKYRVQMQKVTVYPCQVLDLAWFHIIFKRWHWHSKTSLEDDWLDGKRMGTKIHKEQKESEWKIFHLLKEKVREGRLKTNYYRLLMQQNGRRLSLQASKGCCKTPSGSRGKLSLSWSLQWCFWGRGGYNCQSAIMSLHSSGFFSKNVIYITTRERNEFLL